MISIVLSKILQHALSVLTENFLQTNLKSLKLKLCLKYNFEHAKNDFLSYFRAKDLLSNAVFIIFSKD